MWRGFFTSVNDLVIKGRHLPVAKGMPGYESLIGDFTTRSSWVDGKVDSGISTVEWTDSNMLSMLTAAKPQY